MICLTSLLDLSRGCACMLKGPDRLVLDSPLPLGLFVIPRCPSVPAAIKAKVVDVKPMKNLNLNFSEKGQNGNLSK